MTSEISLYAQNHMAHVSRTENPFFRQINRVSGRVKHFTLPRRI